MSKIGQIFKKLFNKRTLIVLIYNFLIKKSFMMVIGIYALGYIIIMTKKEGK